MEFSNLVFLLYFLPISILGYYVVAFSRPLQNFWLLIVSLFLYAWGEPVFVLIMAGSVLINWLMGLLIHASANKKLLKKVLAVLIGIADVGLFGVVKYTNFIVDTVYEIIGWERLTEIPEIILPIGVTIFVLQELSYIADVYKGDAKVQKNPLYLGLYVSFFPQMLCGPVVKYSEFDAQISNRSSSLPLFGEGCAKFVTGLLKKVFIADNLAVVADAVFELAKVGSDVAKVPVLLAWLGAISYVLELYYLLSAYSDMAIGVAKMFGFEYTENFEYPFMAKSVGEFMSKWNISINEWFHKYVYIPFGGGKRKANDIALKALMAVWVLMGLWYGASWNYVWWGLSIFAFVVVEKLVLHDNADVKNKKKSIVRHIYTCVVIIFIMIMFRAENMSHYAQMALDMIGLNGNGFYCDTVGMLIKEFWYVFLTAILFIFPIGEVISDKLSEKDNLKSTFATLSIITLVGFTVVNGWIKKDDFKNDLPSIAMPTELSQAGAYITDVETIMASNPFFDKIQNNAQVYVNDILHKNEKNGFQYVKDKDGNLYEGNFSNIPKFKAKEQSLQIKRLALDVADKGTKVVVLLYPSKYNEEWTNGYYGIPYSNYNTYEEQLLRYFRYYGVEYINFSSIYMEQNLEVEDVFYKTGGNLTTPREFEAFSILTDYLNSEHGTELDLYYTDSDNYFFETHKEVFQGKYGKEIGIGYAGMDDYTLIYPKFNTLYEYTYTLEGENVLDRGNVMDILISREHLQSSDYSDKDAIMSYMGGGHDTDKIVNILNRDGLNVLFMRDSNTVPLATFFASYCSTVELVNMEQIETEINVETETDTMAEFVESTIKNNTYDYIFIAMSIDSIGKYGLEFYVNEEADTDG